MTSAWQTGKSLQNRQPEEIYRECDVEIDGELFSSAGLRAKGNNSLHLTEEYGLKRYSLKIEFDHFQEGNTYYGLDKMSLDASFQDNSYLKNYLAYDMMEYMEVPSPLCSYAWVTVNGEEWGLFLAVEEPEDAFLRRKLRGESWKLVQTGLPVAGRGEQRRGPPVYFRRSGRL